MSLRDELSGLQIEAASSLSVELAAFAVATSAPPPYAEVVDRVLIASPEWRARLGSLWSDGLAGLPEVLVLCASAGLVDEDDPGRLLEGLGRAAADPSSVPALADDALVVRLRTLAAHPVQRRAFLGLLALVSGALCSVIDSDAAAPARRLGDRIGAAISDGDLDAFEALTGLSDGGLDVMRRALGEARTVRLVPAISASVSTIFDVGDEVLVTVAISRRSGIARVDAEQLATRARALGDATRLRILAAAAHESASVGELAEEFGLAQPTVSNHVRALRSARLVVDAIPGQRSGFRLDADGLADLLAALAAIAAPEGDTPVDR
jgi:DNA-binding transcriptional ArsR family regulator